MVKGRRDKEAEGRTSRMKILDVTPMLTVTVIEPAVAFYRDVLGFAGVGKVDGWACMALDDAEVMLALPNAHLPFGRPMMTGVDLLQGGRSGRLVGAVEGQVRGGVSDRGFRVRDAGVCCAGQLQLFAAVRAADQLRLAALFGRSNMRKLGDGRQVLVTVYEQADAGFLSVMSRRGDDSVDYCRERVLMNGLHGSRSVA